MITNTRQYAVTQKSIREFEQTLGEIELKKDELSPDRRELYRKAIQSELEVLREQLAEYDALREGRVSSVELSSLDDLPKALIKARIAAGLTQRQLAEKLERREQQVQRWESREYDGVSFTRMLEVADALGLDARMQVRLPVADEVEV